MWAYDQPNVDFWHSATFSWDGKVANFIDESFGDGCPTMTTKTGGLGPGNAGVQVRQHVLLRDEAAASCCRSTATRGRRTTTSARRRGKYCSSHLGIPVPAKDRYLLVNAYYRGGSSVIDFSDPTAPEGDRVRRPARHEHVVGVHLPAQVGPREHHPGVLERRPEPQLRHARPGAELPGGRLRLHAVPARTSGRTNLVGFDRLNPQLQERVDRRRQSDKRWGDDDDEAARRRRRTYAKGTAAADGAVNRSARHFTK